LSFSVPTSAAACRTDVQAVRSENPTELTRRKSRADSAGSLSSTATTSSIWQLGSRVIWLRRCAAAGKGLAPMMRPMRAAMLFAASASAASSELAPYQSSSSTSTFTSCKTEMGNFL
jgi:hypothetical protein